MSVSTAPKPRADWESTRTQRLARGMATSTLARGLTLATPALLIPVTYRYFGPTQFALWATIVALTSMFLWTDLGLGNGLMTKLPAALASEDTGGARRLISSAYSLLTVVAAALIVLLVAVSFLLPWESILGVPRATNVSETVMVCFGAVLLQSPIGLIQRIQYAAQEAGLNGIYQFVGSISALASALFAIAVGANYITIVAVVAVGPIVGSVLASASFYRRNPELRPLWISPLDPSSKNLLTLGGAFLVVQALSSVAMNLDIPIAAHIVGGSDAASFSATVRIFLVLGALLGFSMLPLWPAAAEALARRDTNWVKRTAQRMSVGAVCVVTPLGCIGAVWGQPVFEAIMGQDFQHDTRLMLGLTATWAVAGGIAPLLMVQNAVGHLKPQLVGWPVLICAFGSLKYVVGNEVGLWALPAAGAAAYLALMGPLAWVGYRQALARITKTPSEEKE